jgi:hypothetical protein
MTRIITHYFFERAVSLILHNEEELITYKKGLFHYTTPAGLLGILKSQKIWATEASYLNDAKELHYGLNLAIEELKSISTKEECKFIISLIQETIDEIKLPNEETYIACFSEDGDLLSQWKGYAGFGLGFSIELDSQELLRTKRKGEYFSIAINKVIYNQEKQRSIIREETLHFISKAKELISLHPEKSEDISGQAASALAYFITNKSIFFKSPAFSEEREWRAIRINPNEDGLDLINHRQEIKFRASNDSIIPYLELDIGPSAQKTSWVLPIKRIISGPKINHERAEKSINLIYREIKTTPPAVEKSAIPLQ